MKCGDVVATSKLRNGKETLIPWSHFKGYIVWMTDGSKATLPMCKDCYDKVDSKDFELMTKKLRYEWMRQQSIAYRNHPEKKQRIVDAGKMSKSKTIARKF